MMKILKVIGIIILSNFVFGIGAQFAINAWLLYQHLIDGQKEPFAIKEYTRHTIVAAVLLTILIWMIVRLISTFSDKTKKPNQQVDPIVKTPVDEFEAQGTQGHP